MSVGEDIFARVFGLCCGVLFLSLFLGFGSGGGMGWCWFWEVGDVELGETGRDDVTPRVKIEGTK
jgi:hypothetical protein